jgi:thiamine biosynthesis protein ThiS
VEDMEIIFNGKTYKLQEGITVSELLTSQGYKSKTSIWVNGKQLLNSEYQTFIISDKSIIKALRVVGGG